MGYVEGSRDLLGRFIPGVLTELTWLKDILAKSPLTFQVGFGNPPTEPKPKLPCARLSWQMSLDWATATVTLCLAARMKE